MTTNNELNLSFAGCGFLGIYHVGVASCFREYCPEVCNAKISGASVGALVATAMACNLPLGESTSDILKVAIQARSRALGPFHPTFDINKILTDALIKTLPENAHVLVNGRLHISVTRVSDGNNVILSQFDSKEDLIQAMLCSCFIPFWSGIVPPKFHGVAYMDGGFSDNLLVLDENTVTVSPFAGESDICPQDTSFSIVQINLANTSIAISPGNIYRLTRILFPPHPEVMSKMCQQGFDDALRFLQRNNRITCTRCVAIRSKHNYDSGYDHSYDDNCIDCQYRREMALLDSLPDPVAKAIQDACDQVNKGVINWIFNNRPIKLLSLLTVPYVLPFDIAIVVLLKVWRKLPAIQRELKQSLLNLIEFTTRMLHKMNGKTHQFSAKFSCQLAVTEFDYTSETNPKKVVYVQSTPASKRTSLNNSPIAERRRKSKVEITDVIDVLKSFGEDSSAEKDINGVEIANRAFIWEKECLNRCQNLPENQNSDAFDRILEVTNRQEALMAFYYLDENNRVKVTEIFNLNEENISPIRNEREANQFLFDPTTEGRRAIDVDAEEDGLPSFKVPFAGESSSMGQRRRRQALED
ncbi:patatin-like phospholipase domain-containing protein 2 [Leptotrombidium deliense]|uniref:triacylglycerol lipase n=1 Tax=Leptotrombidium deliense TaxID=299467 RepID=A0A443SG49_9ACAR|nr:patatin-like phospholipase domain-containing protein 2 [Leptotrombidium deliense]